jgi:hypothetical protein
MKITQRCIVQSQKAIAMTAIKAESSFKLSPATPEELLKVQQIMEIMAGSCDEAKALTALRRNGGNMDKAMSALFDSAADDAPTTSGTVDYSELRAAAAGVVAPHTPPGQPAHRPVPIFSPPMIRSITGGKNAVD